MVLGWGREVGTGGWQDGEWRKEKGERDDASDGACASGACSTRVPPRTAHCPLPDADAPYCTNPLVSRMNAVSRFTGSSAILVTRKPRLTSVLATSPTASPPGPS